MSNKFKIEDFLGKKFNKLTIVGDAGIRGNYFRQVKTTCECGVSKNLRLSSVLHGEIKSCGCAQYSNQSTHKEYAISYINKKFNKLTIIEYVGSVKNKSIVKAICDCGNIKEYYLVKLKNSTTKSCGCLKSQMTKERVMSPIYDIINKKFNRLTVIGYIGSKNKQSIVSAICECGVTKDYLLTSIRNGNTKSCGCLNVENKTTHGLCKHPLHHVWNDMLDRCYNKNCKQYKNYGGRGVLVCSQWRYDFKSFYDWAIDKWIKGLQLDKDKLAPGRVGELYCPEYCSFVTNKINMRNKRDNKILNYNGESLCVSEWSERVNIPHGIIRGRIQSGWTIEKALTKPVDKRYSRACL